MRELRALDLPAGPGGDFDLEPVTEVDLEGLPDSARRYLRFMGVVGRPRDWSFRVGFHGRFRRSRHEPWMKCEAWQYDTRLDLARIFYIQIRFFGLLPVLGRDTYLKGSGRMLIRLLDLITVADGTGEAYDIGELVTYLNDCVLLAPSLLLEPAVSWSAVDDRCFDLALTDRGRTVSARVFVDERGAAVDFETSDRFYADPKDPSRVERCRWTTPIEGWQDVAGRPIPSRARAVWHLPDGELCYAAFAMVPNTLAFNLAPGK